MDSCPKENAVAPKMQEREKFTHLGGWTSFGVRHHSAAIDEAVVQNIPNRWLPHNSAVYCLLVITS